MEPEVGIEPMTKTSLFGVIHILYKYNLEPMEGFEPPKLTHRLTKATLLTA